MSGNAAIFRETQTLPSLKVTGMTLWQDGRRLTEPISFLLPPSTVTCLIGPSGVGKSTLLHRLLEGIHRTSGEVTIYAAGHSPGQSVALMSQRETLLPWLTAKENIVLGRKLSGVRATVTEDQLLELVQLNSLAHRYPDELSGGEKQRLLLARTLSLETPLILLDEPFGKLDPTLRSELIARFREWVMARSCAALVVSHQLDDVAILADRVLRLHGDPAVLSEVSL